MLESDNVDMRSSIYYKKIHKARVREGWSDKRIDKFVQGKIDLMYDIKANGLKNPILIRSDNRIIEGNHRLIITGAMGHQSIVTRMV